ncbi:MAG: hypothetical protein ACXU82_00390 [Caulobacteraceae bacterium]
MNIKTGILAAAAALAMTVPAIASAQPYYGHDGYGRYENYRHDRDDWRRIERERELRREEWRRLRWEREHAYRGYGYAPYYR